MCCCSLGEALGKCLLHISGTYPTSQCTIFIAFATSNVSSLYKYIEHVPSFPFCPGSVADKRLLCFPDAAGIAQMKATVTGLGFLCNQFSVQVVALKHVLLSTSKDIGQLFSLVGFQLL